MTDNKIQPIVGWQSKLRLIFLGVFSIVLILELIFSIFSLPANGRPIIPFDMQAVLAIFVLACVRPKLFSFAWKLDFQQMPLLCKLCACIAGYVLVIKAFYFLGYLAAMLFKHKG